MDARDGSGEEPEPRSKGAGLSSDFDDSLLKGVAACDAEEPEPEAPAVSSVLDGKYRLERMLGRGGMGCVFAARNLTTGRRVAIKWMVRRGDLDQLRKRFVLEARAAGRIRHPNVIDIYDVVSDKQRTYLVMELLEGESLRARLNRGRLEPKEAIPIALSMLEGLREAHRQGVIHRDLKPENVFLCSSPRCTKVLDFGISVLAETRPAFESNLTKTGYFVGTPMYTALERLREKQPFDHRVDLYSVGVILFEALTGELPFSGKTPSELTYQLALSSPRPLRELRSDLTPSLESAVLRALARDPDARFQDAESLIQALNAALEAPPAVAAGWRTHVRWAAGTAVAVGVLGLSAAVASRSRDSAPQPVVRRAPPEQVLARAPMVELPARVASPDSMHTAPARSADPRKRRAARSAPLAVASAAQGATGTAELSVVVFPYGDVWVDGRRIGSSPARLRLAPGAHVVSGGRTSGDRVARVELAAGESRDVVLSWTRSPTAESPSQGGQGMAPADGKPTRREASSEGSVVRPGPVANEIR